MGGKIYDVVGIGEHPYHMWHECSSTDTCMRVQALGSVLMQARLVPMTELLPAFDGQSCRHLIYI